MAVPYAVFVSGGVRTPVYTRSEYLAYMQEQDYSDRAIASAIEEFAEGPAESYTQLVTERAGGDETLAREYIEAQTQVGSIAELPALPEDIQTPTLPDAGIPIGPAYVESQEDIGALGASPAGIPMGPFPWAMAIGSILLSAAQSAEGVGLAAAAATEGTLMSNGTTSVPQLGAGAIVDGIPISGPGVPEPPAQLVAKQWVILLSTKQYGAFYMYFYRLLDGRVMSYHPYKGWKIWRPKKPLAVMYRGKTTLSQAVKVQKYLDRMWKQVAKKTKQLKLSGR